jgi:hypothetical protein
MHSDGVQLSSHGMRHSVTVVAPELDSGDHYIAQLIGRTLSGMIARYCSVQDARLRRSTNDAAQTIANYRDPSASTRLP